MWLLAKSRGNTEWNNVDGFTPQTRLFEKEKGAISVSALVICHAATLPQTGLREDLCGQKKKKHSWNEKALRCVFCFFLPVSFAVPTCSGVASVQSHRSGTFSRCETTDFFRSKTSFFFFPLLRQERTRRLSFLWNYLTSASHAQENWVLPRQLYLKKKKKN